jgi:hypothetical protein
VQVVCIAGAGERAHNAGEWAGDRAGDRAGDLAGGTAGVIRYLHKVLKLCR